MSLQSLIRAALPTARAVLVLAVATHLHEVAAAEDRGTFAENRQAFVEKLSRLRWWLPYNPSTFEPGRKVNVEEIRADLEALVRAGFKPDETGICTYSCSPTSGHDLIPRVARELHFAGCIVGVWSASDELELEAAKKVARDGLADATCLGNEGLESRYDWEELRDAMRQLRRDTKRPVATSEQIEDYGDSNLVDPNEVDWVYPNVHPVFRNETNPSIAVAWVNSIMDKLAKRTKLPILVHETGWPSQGLSCHNAEAQAEFWLAMRKSKHAICLFEAFDQKWKKELVRDADVGGSWGLMSADRKPKLVTIKLTSD